MVKVMFAISSFLKLIRFSNLLIIALIQYITWWAIIDPLVLLVNSSLHNKYPLLVKSEVLHLQISQWHFFLLVLSTVLVAAAGYIINDYFDTSIDYVNKPEKVVVGKGIKRRVAMGAHIVISVIAIVIGFWISNRVGMTKLGFLFPVVSGLLWYYSVSFKYRLFVGNFVISFLAAMVPLIVALYEVSLLNQKYNILYAQFGVTFSFIYPYILGFSLLALVLTFIREIVKDMEDVEGDSDFGANTIPLRYGIKASRNLVVLLLLALIVFLLYLQSIRWHATDGKLSVSYIFIFIQLPLFYAIQRLGSNKFNSKENFHFVSVLLKVVMFFGILFWLLFRFLILSGKW